jgi:hypothetical protein
MLYWAEGGKTRNSASVTNADPEVLRFFVGLVRANFDVLGRDFRVTCNLFADHVDRQSEIERFWLDTLELDEWSLCKSIVNVYSKYSQKKRKNMLPYGTCRVAVHRTAIVQHIYGAMQEYGGFDRPAWLDDRFPTQRTRGWGPARGALRPPRPAPRPTGLATGRVGHTAWCMPSPRARQLGIDHLA